MRELIDTDQLRITARTAERSQVCLDFGQLDVLESYAGVDASVDTAGDQVSAGREKTGLSHNSQSSRDVHTDANEVVILLGHAIIFRDFVHLQSAEEPDIAVHVNDSISQRSCAIETVRNSPNALALERSEIVGHAGPLDVAETGERLQSNYSALSLSLKAEQRKRSPAQTTPVARANENR